jgi:hypothetical protein
MERLVHQWYSAKDFFQGWDPHLSANFNVSAVSSGVLSLSRAIPDHAEYHVLNPIPRVRAFHSRFASDGNQAERCNPKFQLPSILWAKELSAPWSQIHDQPVKAELLHHLLELVEIYRLLNIAVDA